MMPHICLRSKKGNTTVSNSRLAVLTVTGFDIVDEFRLWAEATQTQINKTTVLWSKKCLAYFGHKKQ